MHHGHYQMLIDWQGVTDAEMAILLGLCVVAGMIIVIALGKMLWDDIKPKRRK